ncbi:unnamed protein product [Brassica rapa subsp. trilocularis]
MNRLQEEQLTSKNAPELEPTLAAKSNLHPPNPQPPRTNSFLRNRAHPLTPSRALFGEETTKSRHRLPDLHQENRTSKHHLESNKEHLRRTPRYAEKHRNATAWRNREAPSTK